MNYEIWHMFDGDIPEYNRTVYGGLSEAQRIAFDLAVEASQDGNITVMLGMVYYYGGGRYIIKAG